MAPLTPQRGESSRLPPSLPPPDPLRVVLVHRDSPRMLQRDVVGWWSYPVPEFVWDHYPVGKGFHLRRSDFRAYDWIVYEDGKIQGTIERDGGPPVAYVIADSTLSEAHYHVRCREAVQNADLLLVDWDDLNRFRHLGLPVYRYSYCSNDHLFYPRQKTLDVGYFCHPTPERIRLGEHLADLCEQRGWRYAGGRRMGAAYAEAIGSAKVNVNLNRNPATRSNRIFDIFVSRSCLLTSPLPPVSDEPRALNEHYLQYRSWRELDDLLAELLEAGSWSVYAEAAYDLGKRYHTWSARATQLRLIMSHY